MIDMARKKKELSPEQQKKLMEKVITLYQNGKTFNEIAVECKVSKKDAIHYVLDTKYNISNN